MKTQSKKWIIAAIVVFTTITVLGVYFNKKDEPIVAKKIDTEISANYWSRDTNFFTLKDSTNLAKLAKSVGLTLERNKGLDHPWSADTYIRYKDDQKVYWAVWDITEDKMIICSENAAYNVYGASVPKVCVSAASLTYNGGKLQDKDWRNVIRLLVVSDNSVWGNVQNLAGKKGTVNHWADSLEYSMRPEFNGGNSVNAFDMAIFWSDVCHNRFPGSEAIFKITSSCRTGTSRSRWSMPNDVYMGGKTGTYGVTNHDCCWIQKGNKFYSICVLTELGARGTEVISSMFRGLYEDYCK